MPDKSTCMQIHTDARELRVWMRPNVQEPAPASQGGDITSGVNPYLNNQSRVRLLVSSFRVPRTVICLQGRMHRYLINMALRKGAAVDWHAPYAAHSLDS